ncbi:MAG TPA: molybdenum cofactor guanylyltransferase MobA [Pseudomonadales bacterium]
MVSAARMISAVVLCGGAGRRFGGADKPLLELAGRPLVAHVLARLSGQVDEVVISANRNRDRYEGLGVPVVADGSPGLGPLAGIAAALSSCRGELLFVCPGDSPGLATDLVARLDACLDNAPAADAAVAHDGIRDQVLFLLIRRPAAQTVVEHLAKGGRSVFGWLAELSTVRCPINDAGSFLNVNTPEELAALESNWERESS